MLLHIARPLLPTPVRTLTTLVWAPAALATAASANAAAAAMLPAPASTDPADAPSLMVSTTGDAGAIAPGLPDLVDSDLVRLRAGATPRPWMVRGNWRALTGFEPSDVDGLGWRPGRTPGRADALALSLLTNQDGFLDGDVLGIGDDGAPVILFAEEFLAQSLGVPDASIDVDAVSFDDAGALLFSLQSDLEDTVLGTVANGDVLRLDTLGTLSRLAGEADIEASLALATGAGVGIGDVHGVTWTQGELWVAVQSPSEFDGGVLAVGANARVVADEQDLGLAGEELDALAALTPDAADPLALWIDDPVGGSVGVVTGGTPGAVGLALATALGGHQVDPALGGFGAFGIDVNDPVLAAQLQGAPTLFVFDGEGRFESPVGLPVVGAGLAQDGSLGWTFQVLDLASLALSPAFRADV